MRRDDFLKTLLLGGLALPLSSSWTGWPISQDYTRSQLTGHGNPELRGSEYRSIMHQQARAAFDRMRAAARLEGIEIEVVSAYRSFDRQKAIYEQKYRRFLKQGHPPEMVLKKIIEYSTIPGTSRHHWGTELDLIDAAVPRPADVLRAGNYHGTGVFVKLREWLEEHAADHGFLLVYTDRPGRKGFKYEPWHYSYAPVSVPMLRAFLKLDIKSVLTEEAILGSEHFSDDFIQNYLKEHILDINPSLL